MGRLAGGVALVILVGACGFLGKGIERDHGVYYLWAKRGQEMGDLVHVLCSQASARERSIFMTTLGESAGRVRVTILCDGGGE